MERSETAGPAAGAPSPSPSLKPGAIGFVDALVIGLAATSPAYSLAAILGPVVALVGIYAAGTLLASFVPMLLIASAFYYLNKVDQDCGTTFSWVTRAMGPTFGWIGGWAITLTGVLVIGSLAEVGVRFGLLTLGLDELADNQPVVMAGAVALIALMTWLCVLGTEVSARVQNGLILAQVGALLAFAVVALVRVAAGDAAVGAPAMSLAWLDPFGAGGAALTGGLLLGVFAYWGWESAVNLSEETSDPASAPGRAAVLSTLILLLTYVGVAFALVAVAGTEFLAENAEEEEFIFGLLAEQVLGGWDWVVLLAVTTSAIASTQTTIIPASRTALSMARRGAIPPAFARIHPRFRTPDVATWAVAAIAVLWYLGLSAVSENALFDSLTALSLLIAFYYALTGIACALYYRRHLLESVRNLLLIGIGPVVGAVMLLWLLVESVIDMADPENSYTGQAWFGMGPPLVIGIVILAVGLVLLAVSRVRGSAFWAERAGVADPGLVPGGAREQR
ncbi:APC family permease [Actinotalea sp.]|uniref:APC family permease n=1 Tax=Actinotalea sp. TaxID=1872145 RepID=UPI002BF6C6AC|nr:APC family permease [Actinotalea sp.]HQY32962.1 APC family permease [Actinotalea sp.]HRA51216.1 APC family permease [Actinotalea sp.]